MQRLLRVVLVLGVLALAGTLVNTGTLLADDDDRDNGDRHRPPQTLPQGFERTDQLQRDVERAEGAPLYSAWLVESTRFTPASPSFPRMLSSTYRRRNSSRSLFS